jgi:hypothetical protein
VNTNANTTPKQEFADVVLMYESLVSELAAQHTDVTLRLGGAVYNQLFDVEGEQDGLLTYKRAFKKGRSSRSSHSSSSSRSSSSSSSAVEGQTDVDVDVDVGASPLPALYQRICDANKKLAALALALSPV